MKRPVKIHHNTERETVNFYFKDDVRPHETIVRGSICWPITTELGGEQSVLGVALVAGIDVAERRLTVYEQRPFVVIQSILDKDGKITYDGISLWFNRVWTRYGCRRFYWNQDHHITKKYRLEVLRNEYIVPQPVFLKIDWSDDDAAIHTIWRYIQTRKILYEGGSPLQRSLSLLKQGEKSPDPYIRALMALLEGVERFPRQDIK